MKKVNYWLILMFFLGTGGSAFSQLSFTTEFNITSGTDDAEQDLISGEMDLSSSDIEITQDGSSDQLIGLRFTDINIPSAATITSAYLQVTVDEVHTNGDLNVLIGTENVANPSTYSSAPHNLTNRASNAFLGSVHVWAPGPFAVVNDATDDQKSVDISDLIQNAISHPDWQTGNAISILMVDPVHAEIPGYTGNNGVKRVFKTHNNNPADAAKLVISYTMPDIYYTGLFPITTGSSWLYNDLGQDLGTENWTALDYEADSAWAWGDAPLGYGDGDEATVLSFGPNSSDKYPTYYFRHKFDAADISGIDSLVFNVRRDDGAVVYVNGIEAFRMNMPEGDITYNTFASGAVGGSSETTFYEVRTANLLQEGSNVIAVELHQSDANSSDLTLDMSVGFIAVPLSPATFPLAPLSQWNYLDTGVSLDDTIWTTTDYDDYEWQYGQGPLGYGDPMTTVISYGPDAGNKYITTYFRRTMDIDMASFPDTVLFGLRRDDGAVVYVNGEEVFRSNMPEGDFTYQTHSASIVDGAAEQTYNLNLVSGEYFVDGLNQIAVEVHNRDEQSSDLGFDLYIKEVPEPPVINPPADCSNPHIGCFTSIMPTSQQSTMIYPESHRFQLIFKQGSAYTSGQGNVPGNHDFTAYIPVDGSSENGILGINHETTPGGVSLVDLHFDEESLLWVVDSSMAVDFFDDNLVTTTRNCSGGITPWGTIITSEESFNGGDVNEDGYVDVGWNVEIDPVTRQVMDYDGDGVKDKLWAMGRMSHENVVVANDSVTVFYGEDGGTHCVYKFVADEPGNLSSGSVYVLSLDFPLLNNDPTGPTGTWIQVPNDTQEDRNNMRTLAAALGGTNFNGVEDCEISPIDGMVYFTSKGKGRTYRFLDGEDGITHFETFVGGTTYEIQTATGIINEPWGGGNDNLTFDDQGNLWVLQDGSRNYIWVVRPDHSQINPKVELFLSPPAGSEPTGLTFSPDYRFGFFSIQHPSGANSPQTDATGEEVTFNSSAVVIFALKEELGAQPPTVAISASENEIIQGESVTFTDLSTYEPLSWEWNFEGGTPATSTEQNPTVEYNEVGTFAVTLTATNDAGSDTKTFTEYITVNYPVPGVDFESNVTEIFAGESVSFTDLSTNEPSSWSWTFEGGTPATSTEENPTVVFNEVGTFDVTLVSSNSTGDGEVNVKADYIISIIPFPVAEFQASATDVVQGDTVYFSDMSMNAPTNWLWVFEGGEPSTSSEQNPVVIYNTPGTFDVALISTNSTGTGPVKLEIDHIFVDQAVGTSGPSFGENTRIYPNPTEGMVSVELSLNGGDQLLVELYDINGKKLADLGNTQAAGGTQTFAFDISKHVDSTQILLVKVSVNGQHSSHLVQFVK